MIQCSCQRCGTAAQLASALRRIERLDLELHNERLVSGSWRHVAELGSDTVTALRAELACMTEERDRAIYDRDTARAVAP